MRKDPNQGNGEAAPLKSTTADDNQGEDDLMQSKNDEIVVIDKMPESFTEPNGQRMDQQEPQIINDKQDYNSGSDDEIEEQKDKDAFNPLIDSPATQFEKGIRTGSLVLDSDEEEDLKTQMENQVKERNGVKGQEGIQPSGDSNTNGTTEQQTSTEKQQRAILNPLGP